MGECAKQKHSLSVLLILRYEIFPSCILFLPSKLTSVFATQGLANLM